MGAQKVWHVYTAKAGKRVYLGTVGYHGSPYCTSKSLYMIEGMGVHSLKEVRFDGTNMWTTTLPTSSDAEVFNTVKRRDAKSIKIYDESNRSALKTAKFKPQ